ncbi:Rho termination factor N-terminal domain-containing protein [Bacillus cereus]
MITEIRKTISGTEYWDSKEKKSLFVPTGEEPGFEVTVNPESMLIKHADNKIVDVEVIDTKTENDLNDMNAEQLLSFAKGNGIDVPAKLKKEETIRNYIVEQLTTDTE